MNNKVEQLSNLFGSKTRYKILRLYAENSHAKFYVREITRMIDEQINSVRRELENLESLGLLISKDKNNKRYFSINAKSSIYPGLCMIMGCKQAAKTSQPRVTKPTMADSDGVAELKKLCSELVIKSKDYSNDMPVDVFCVVKSSSDKITALELLKTVEAQLKYSIEYSVLTNDEYELGSKLNPQLYDTIYRAGIKLI